MSGPDHEPPRPAAPGRADARAGEATKTAGQVLAIVLLLGLFAMLAHKAHADLAALAAAHDGGDFWLALLRYVFRNLAG